MTVDEFLAALITNLQGISNSLAVIAKTVPNLITLSPVTRIVLGLPTIIRNGKIMANTLEVKNDAVYWYPIWDVNSGGVMEPPITGDVYSVALGAPVSQSGSGAPLNAVIGVMPTGPDAGAMALGLNALNMLAAGIPISVSDTKGLIVYTNIVDIVADTTPTNITLDIPGVVTVPQPVPAS